MGKQEHKMKQFSWKNMAATCGAGLGENEKKSKVEFFNTMCVRCSGPRDKKRSNLCKKKWDKFMKGKWQEDGLLTETPNAWPALQLDADRKTEGEIVDLGSGLEAYYVSPTKDGNNI